MKRILALVFFVALSAISFAQSASKDRDSVAQTSAFQVKVKMASIVAANNILADTSRPQRVMQYAQTVITEPNGAWLLSMSYGCMSNAAINYNSSDGDIQYTINSIFTKYAFAFFKERQTGL